MLLGCGQSATTQGTSATSHTTVQQRAPLTAAYDRRQRTREEAITQARAQVDRLIGGHADVVVTVAPNVSTTLAFDALIELAHDVDARHMSAVRLGPGKKDTTCSIELVPSQRLARYNVTRVERVMVEGREHQLKRVFSVREWVPALAKTPAAKTFVDTIRNALGSLPASCDPRQLSRLEARLYAAPKSSLPPVAGHYVVEELECDGERHWALSGIIGDPDATVPDRCVASGSPLEVARHFQREAGTDEERLATLDTLRSLDGRSVIGVTVDGWAFEGRFTWVSTERATIQLANNRQVTRALADWRSVRPL